MIDAQHVDGDQLLVLGETGFEEGDVFVDAGAGDADIQLIIKIFRERQKACFEARLAGDVDAGGMSADLHWMGTGKGWDL